VTAPAFRAVVYDLECTNLKSDLGLLLCAAFLDLNDGTVVSKTIKQGGEKALARWCAKQVEAADLLIGHNETAFDRHFIDGVLTRHGLPPLPRRIHIDTYQTARHGWGGIPSSYSLRNLSAFFGLSEEKESLGKEYWRTALTDPESMRLLLEHCEADVRVTALLWEKLRPFYMGWRGR